MSPTIACTNCSEPIVPGARFCFRCGFDVSGPQGNLTTNELRPTGHGSRDTDFAVLEHLRRATLGEYDIVGELGRGGMAIVYLAHDIALDRKVAIKVMNPALMMGAGMPERFKREARTAAALTHPNIIPIHMVRETEDLLFFVMKYVEGRGLDSILAETGPLPVQMILTILGQVGGALGYAHRRGVIHRDVKPANILIDTEGWVVVTDFGIAKVAEAGTLTVSGMTVGTPRYMSPEQCSARPVTGASDQYSLGIVAFEMISGRPPFAGDSLMDIMRMHFFETPPLLKSLRPESPTGLAAAVERMLAKDAGERWPSVEDAIAAAGRALVDQDDSVRSHMIDLAKTGIKPIARMSTPLSPTPLGRNPVPMVAGPLGDAAPLAPPITPASSPARRSWRRPLIWGMTGLAAAAVSLGIYLRARSAPSGEGPVTSLSGSRPDSIASIEITGVPQSVEEGQQVQLSALAKNLAGATIPSATVRWSSSEDGVARVSQEGLLTGIAAGTATVEASAGGQRRAVRVTVKPAAVASIVITPASLSVAVRETARLTATTGDSLGGTRHIKLTWSTDNPSVASVSQEGVVTGVAPGSTMIQASSDGIRGRASVAVTPSGLASVQLLPAAPTLTVGASIQLSSVAQDANGLPIRKPRLQWTTSDPQVATVSVRGMVVAVAPGSTRITATIVGGSSGASVVTVRPPTAGFLKVGLTSVATLLVDGASYGQADRFRIPVSAGVSHTLRFEADGYATIDTSVAVSPGDSVLLQIGMTRALPVAAPRGFLRVQIKPAWAVMSIDGKIEGRRAVWADSLAAGSHQIRFERDGYVTVDTSVTVQPSETLPVLRITMRLRNP